MECQVEHWKYGGHRQDCPAGTARTARTTSEVYGKRPRRVNLLVFLIVRASDKGLLKR